MIWIVYYTQTNRFVDIDFSGLDMTINLHTWVVLLDFLGMGAKVHDPENYTEKAQMAKGSPTTPDVNRTEEGEHSLIIKMLNRSQTSVWFY